MDNLYLTGQNGSMMNVGSWIEKTEGVDYGAAGLIRQQFAQSDLYEGARLAYETTAGQRTMTFPLIVPSGGAAGLSLDAIEAWLRTLARPGGTLDIQPDGVPTAEMVRFDLLGGDVAHRSYSVDLQRIDRRRMTLTLQTQPYGYWPTQILLASAAPATAPLQLTWNQASVIGDAPAQAVLQIRKLTASTNFGGVASLFSFSGDALWWSLSRPSGATIMLAPSDFFAATSYANIGPSDSIFAAAVVSDTYSPLGFSLQTRMDPSMPGWIPFAVWQPAVGTAIDQMYRSQPFRLFAYLRTTPSWAKPVMVTADETGANQQFDFLASSNPVATLLPQANASFGDVASSALGALPVPAASGFQIVDLGEHTLPPVGSGLPAATTTSQWMVRLWANFGSQAPGVASPAIELGGLYMLPLGQAGVITRGMIYPTQMNVVSSQGGQITSAHSLVRHVTFDGINNRALLLSVNVGSNYDTYLGVTDEAWSNFRGRLPYLAGTNVSLDVGFGGRRWGAFGASNAMLHAPLEQLGASISYRPRFAFLKGI